MTKKAIILCGGTGSRMFPLTHSVNKQLLPILDKPMFYYPLSLLMLCGIKDFIFIVNKNQEQNFRNTLGDQNDLGIKVRFVAQEKPRGLPDAFLITEKFIKNKSVAMILGDNFFYGNMLSPLIRETFKLKDGCNIYLYPSKKPSSYGVVEFNKKNQIKKIVEKPKKTTSNSIITGLYVFDKNVISFTKLLKPSKRKELEITDLLKIYKSKKKLKAEFLGRGGTWLDTGNIEDFYNTSSFVSAVENRQGLKIACIEEIALKQKWIKKIDIKKALKFYGDCNYSQYLKRLLK